MKVKGLFLSESEGEFIESSVACPGVKLKFRGREVLNLRTSWVSLEVSRIFIMCWGGGFCSGMIMMINRTQIYIVGDI